MDFLGLLSRWLHVTSAVVLLGGLLYARFVVAPAVDGSAGEKLAAAFRPKLWAAMAALIASGLYNLLAKSNLPKGYHMVFGIKMLLALHIFAVALVASRSGLDPARRTRLLTGLALSGLLVLLLSAYLRALTLNL